MKKSFGIVLLAIVGGGVMCGCNQTQDQTQNEAKNHNLAALRELASKYGATQDWETALTNRTGVLTIDVQDALLNKSAPLEFTAELADVRREGDHIVARFDAHTDAPISLSLRLICTEDQRKILTHKEARFAIVADIQKVVKQGDLNIADATRDENGQIDDVTVEANWDTDTYCATGTCLDLRKLRKLDVTRTAMPYRNSGIDLAN